jgi:hypothetical protein
MCSGCSGDYAGGFEDSSEGASDCGDDDRPRGNCGEPQAQGSQRSSRDARGFEGGWNSKQDPQSATVSGLGNESAADFCEILVSATRIMEIRVIAANGGRISELAQNGTAKTPIAGKHSRPSSAKYYQTRRTASQNSTDRVQVSFLLGIVGFVTRHFGRGAQYARIAMGNREAKISQ